MTETRGRPKKYATEEERVAAIREYKKKYHKQYYETKKEIICAAQRANYLAKTKVANTTSI